jgi:hypothetical protein
VVVYKRGFEPVQEPSQMPASAVSARPVPRKKKLPPESAGAAPKPPTSFVKVSAVKRDRRTIEAYQLEKNKSKKRREGGEGEGEAS